MLCAFSAKKMANLTADTIIEATGGRLLSADSRAFDGISIDSRTIKEGDMFFALRGERFDGHNFLNDALYKADGAVIDSPPVSLPAKKTIIQVKDTLKALQDLAHYRRTRLTIPVVAITGSNGKTTTKEMTHSILSGRFRAFKNKGNLNNHIGLPLSLAEVASDVEVIVLELGMNAPGEIKRLCEIALPSHGIITNIGAAHIGRLGSRYAIRDAKLEMLNGLSTVVLNGDDDFLMEGVKDFGGEIITFSINSDSHVMARDIHPTEKGSRFTLVLRDGGKVPVSLKIHGIFNVYNALAASAVCFSLGAAAEDIKSALEAYTAFPMRFEVIEKGGITIINDSYNANPVSVEEALKELSALNKGRTAAVLGDMFELGEFSEDEHRRIGGILHNLGIDVFVAVGEMMSIAAEEAIMQRDGKPIVYTFKNAEEAAKNMKDIIKRGDTVLIKGSRSMGMESIAKEITNAL